MTPRDLLNSAQAARRQGRMADARREIEQALTLARAGGGDDLIAALKALGQIERDVGAIDAAIANYAEAAALARDAGDPLGLAHTLRHIADIQQEAGRNSEALPLYEEALALYRANAPGALDLANALRPFAILRETLGDRDAARALFAEARDLYASANVTAGATECARRVTLLSP